jgi:hypothetical protein
MSRTYKETMFEDYHLDVIDVIAVEREARALRSQAMREALRGAARWIAARLGNHTAAGTAPQA